MTIGNIICELRKEKGLSQKKMAEAIGVSQAAIAKIEINRNEATASTIRKLATFFDVTADYLLGLEDDGIKTAAPMNGSLSYSSEERELIEKFRELNAPGRKLVKTVIDTHLATLAENNKKRI